MHIKKMIAFVGGLAIGYFFAGKLATKPILSMAYNAGVNAKAA